LCERNATARASRVPHCRKCYIALRDRYGPHVSVALMLHLGGEKRPLSPPLDGEPKRVRGEPEASTTSKTVAFDCCGGLLMVPSYLLQKPALSYLNRLAAPTFAVQTTAIGIFVHEERQYVSAVVQSVKNSFLTIDPAVSVRGVYAVAQRWCVKDLLDAILEEHPELKQCSDFEPGEVHPIQMGWCNVGVCRLCGLGFVQAENGPEACKGRHRFLQWGSGQNCQECDFFYKPQDPLPLQIPPVCCQGWHKATE